MLEQNREKEVRMTRGAYEEFSVGYYGICTVGGMLSAGTTHLAITPLDVLKVNMQVVVLLSYIFFNYMLLVS